ncbi:sensor histidine kinase [Demequina pelophila]|uniref:sensor histidine kinase n=1 Tax=Demequina pelophila TaxID=1638984 RepID=UPI000785DA68|nr:histidine kinase [Demequina pelophila]
MHLSRQRLGDVAIAAALLVLALMSAFNAGALGLPVGRAHDAFGYALLVAQVVPLVWRQSAPRTVLWSVFAPWVAYVGLGYSDNPASFALYVALYGIAAYLPRRSAVTHGVVVAGLTLAWTAVGVLITDYVPWTSLIAAALAVVVPMMIGFVDHRRRERITELELAEERREQAERVIAADAVRAERARIARELHDVVAHEITVMTLQAEGARRLARDADPRVTEALATIAASGRTGLSEMQRMIGLLRASEEDAERAEERDREAARAAGAAGTGGPDGPGRGGSRGVGGPDGPEPDGRAPMPSLAGLPALAQQVEDAGLPVELSLSGTAEVPAGVELSAYRIVQEALTNAMKHAGPGARARVRIERRPDAVEVAVEDDGRGAISEAARQSGGHGLRGMAERVQALGGTLDYGPRRGGGFRVAAVLPTGRDDAVVRGARRVRGAR